MLPEYRDIVRLQQQEKRPPVLPALYVSLGVLNGLDLYRRNARGR